MNPLGAVRETSAKVWNEASKLPEKVVPYTISIVPDRTNIWVGKNVAYKTANTAKELFKAIVLLPCFAGEVSYRSLTAAWPMVSTITTKVGTAVSSFFHKKTEEKKQEKKNPPVELKNLEPEEKKTEVTNSPVGSDPVKTEVQEELSKVD